MNDDFLHRIRTEPSAEFLARLKSRLDLQPPPTTPALAASTLKRVLLGLLLTGSVFAITLMLLNHSEPQAPPLINASSESVAHETTTPTTTNPPKLAARPAIAPKAKPLADSKQKTLATSIYSFVTTKALQPFLTTEVTGGRGAPIITSDSAADAIAEFCNTRPGAKSDTRSLVAVITRRMTRAEQDTCYRKFGETALGHQAIVLIRSKLYGTFSLTPTDLFLALAAEIPDPNQPDKLIPNPNTMWSDVNSSLEREPIEFLGPAVSSPVGVAFREMFIEVGCRAQPALAEAEKCPDIRTDGVYVEAAPVPGDMLLKLQTKPDAIGILAYGNEFVNADEFTASPIRGVPPTLQTINDGTYAGSRPLYAYSDRVMSWVASSYLVPAVQNQFRSQRFAIIPPERSQP